MSKQNIQIKQVVWPDDAARVQGLRHQVFIVEQGIPEALEWDGRDQYCLHLLALLENNQAVGTIRMQKNGHIGRMAVLSDYRNQHIGSLLLEKMLHIAKSRGINNPYLNAQCSVASFYELFDFVATGPVYEEAGIPHQRMEFSVQQTNEPVI